MDQKTANLLTAAILVAILAVALFFWFFMPARFGRGFLLIILPLLTAIFTNAIKKGMSTDSAVIAVAAILILGFAWFYMREEFIRAKRTAKR